MASVILVASGKGGTGKTVFTANMGALLAMRGYKVALIDMDMGLRNLDLYMGLESKIVYNISDVLSGICRIKQALVRDKRFKDLYLMAATPFRDDREITPLHMKILCEKLKEGFDYIIIDSPAGMGEGLALAAAGADKAVIITEAEFAAVRDADTLDKALKEMGLEKRYCVVNKIKADLMASGVIPGIDEISRNLRLDIAGVIQYDDNVHISTNSGIPIVMKKGTYIEKNFNTILDRIIR